MPRTDKSYPWLLGTRLANSAGTYQWVGGIDEFRIRTFCQSAAAVSAEYQMMMKREGFLSCTAEADASFLGTFAKRVNITVNGLTGDQALTNFPLAVRLSQATVSNYFTADDMRADGRDICFADTNGNLLAFEVDTWNPAGESIYWVKVPELANGTVVRCYYGRTEAAFAGNGVGTVWHGYAGVWHVNETTDGDVAMADASGIGIPTTGAAISKVSNGVFGKARGTDLDDGATALGGFEAVACQALDLGNSFTLSGWIYGYSCSRAQYIAARCKNDFAAAWSLGCYKRGTGSRDITFSPQVKNTNGKTFSSSSFVSPNAWHKVDLVVSGRTATFYLDGELYSASLDYAVDVSHVDPNLGAMGLAFGGAAGGNTGNTANMIFDEMRYSAGPRSADWIRAEYRASSLAATQLATYSRAQPNDIEAFRKSFLRSVDLAVAGLDAGAALTNFPLSVKLSPTTVSNFNASEMRTDGHDLCFLSAEGKLLSFEVDTWNPAGESVYWVKVPVLTNGLHICCLYGRTAQAFTEEKDPEVWRELPPIGERLDVRGRTTATLTVASECEDTCFYVRAYASRTAAGTSSVTTSPRCRSSSATISRGRSACLTSASPTTPSGWRKAMCCVSTWRACACSSPRIRT